MARPATSGLTPELLVDAAATMVAERGFDGLSVRALAQQLGVAPMTLYRYVGSKDELLQALADRMLEGLEIPPPDEGTWQDQLTAIFRSMHRLLLANPELAEATIRQPIAGEAAYRGAEAVLDALARGGIEGEDAIAAFGGLVALTQGFTLHQLHATDGRLADRLRTLETLPDEQHPRLKALGPAFLLRDTDRHFETALATAIRGLTAIGDGRRAETILRDPGAEGD